MSCVLLAPVPEFGVSPADGYGCNGRECDQVAAEKISGRKDGSHVAQP